MIVGILAFQGDVAEHASMLALLGVASADVRTRDDLSRVQGLIIPGGESTVMAKFLRISGLDHEIISRVQHGSLGIFGTCAGAILSAAQVTGKHAPVPLNLINITIARNAYGTQRDSFDATLSVTGIDHPVPCSFIRAPRVTRVGDGVEVLATHDGSPVILRHGAVLVATCHPELRGDPSLHAFFREVC